MNPDQGIPISANLGIVNANRNSLLGGGALIGGSNTQIEYTGDGGNGAGCRSRVESTFEGSDGSDFSRWRSGSVRNASGFCAGASGFHQETSRRHAAELD